MKFFPPILCAIALFSSLAACRPVPAAISPSAPPSAPIRNYREIPGITMEEALAIEALKTARGSVPGAAAFSVGVLGPDPSGRGGEIGPGFSEMLCPLLSELFGAAFEPEICEWDELAARLESRSLDFVIAPGLPAEWKRKFRVSSPLAEGRFWLFTHAGSDKIETEADADGRRLGFLRDSAAADFIREVYPLSFEAVPAASYREAAEMLARGEIDGFAGPASGYFAFEEYGFIDAAEFFPMARLPVSMAAADPRLAPAISAIDKYLASGGAARLEELRGEAAFEFAQFRLRGSFTDEERAYIDGLERRGGAIAVAVPEADFDAEPIPGNPLAALDEIGKLAGLRFKTVSAKGPGWTELFENARRGDPPMTARFIYPDAEGGAAPNALPYTRSYFSVHKSEPVLRSIIDKAQLYAGSRSAGWRAVGAASAFDAAAGAGGPASEARKKRERSLLFAAAALGGALLFLVAALVALAAKNANLRRALRDNASHDALTGILSKRYFLELGAIQIQRSARLGKECFVFVLDIDGFKAVNDEFGNAAGDLALREIAQTIKKAVRPYDLVGRYGGEEFIVLMFDAVKEDAVRAAERIRLAVSNTPVKGGGREIRVSASSGMAYAAPRNDLNGAIECAGEALYRAKEAGKNRGAFYGDA